MIIAKQFLKSLPRHSRLTILDKLANFEQTLLDVQGVLYEIPAGFWIRRVKNTNIFKFRLNNSDRILFTFLPDRKIDNSEESGHQILFLKYVSHDQQIRDAKNMDISKQIRKHLEVDSNISNDMEHEFDMNQSSYLEENRDKQIDHEITERFHETNIFDIPAIIVDDDCLSIIADENNEDYIYYLSDDQYKALQHFGKPMIISGAGGTGKTAILVNKLLGLEKSGIKTAYIAYTDLLVDDTKRIIHKYNNKCDNCDFFSIKNFYAKHCQIQSGQIVTYYDFLEWFKTVRFKHKNLRHVDELAIWTEIRGIIKGYLGLEYQEVPALSAEKSIRILPLDKYFSLPRGYSHFSPADRKALYKLALEYNQWLSDSELVDENDAALEIARKIEAGQIEKYDYLIIDEVQDLSETQIYMVSKLVKNRANIIFAGDVHQTINPTFFNFGRVKNLFYTYNTDMEDVILTKNYRNPKEVVEMMNTLAHLRQQFIGKTAYDYETKAIRSGEQPIVLNPSEQNLVQILETIKDKHYAAIIVPDEAEKEKLANIHPEALGRIFTVYEIKGLEYETIFCYNIVSKHAKAWQRIFSGEEKRNDQLRYYMNLFYVAISRAKDYLYILEPHRNQLPPALFAPCAKMDRFNQEASHISKQSTKEDWEKEAHRLEQTGNKEKSRLARDFAKEEQIQSLNRLFDGRIVVQPNSPQLNLSVDKENKSLKEGITLLRLQQYGKAIQVLNQFIEEYPENPEGYYYLGMVYTYAASGTDYSIRFFDEALRLKPDWYEVYLDKASSQRFINQRKEAIETLDAAIEINSKIGNAYFIKGMILQEMGKTAEAKKYFKKALNRKCYTFDSMNKAWNRNPSKQEEQAFKNNIKRNYLAQNSGSITSAQGDTWKEIEKLFKRLAEEAAVKQQREPKKRKKPAKVSNDPIDYSLFILDEEGRSIAGCTEGNVPLQSTYNAKTKKYTVQFDKELCKVCDKFAVCPVKHTNKKGELQLRKKDLLK